MSRDIIVKKNQYGDITAYLTPAIDYLVEMDSIDIDNDYLLVHDYDAIEDQKEKKVSIRNFFRLIDGKVYRRVLTSSVTPEGQVYLDETVDGTYSKVLSTSVTAGGLVILSEVSGSLDDVDDGSTYGKILKTDISAGSIKLSSVVFDDTSRFVDETYITAGRITLSAVSDAGDLASQDEIEWASDIADIPDRFTDSATVGLNLTATHLGYYNGTSWPAYIGSDGTFQFLSSDGDGITFDGDDVYVSGDLKMEHQAVLDFWSNTGSIAAFITCDSVAYGYPLLVISNETYGILIDGDLQVDGDMFPGSTTCDVGYSSSKWRNAHFSGTINGVNIDISGTLDVDGDCTLQTCYTYGVKPRTTETYNLGTVTNAWYRTVTKGLKVTDGSDVQIGSSGSTFTLYTASGGGFDSVEAYIA